jgi:hypothetical protein
LEDFFNCTIISAHAPVEDAGDGKKDAFYEAYEECPRHDIKILVWDMNAEIGRDSMREPNIGRYGLHDGTNDSGSHLVGFALAHNLIIGGTLFVDP